MCGIFLQISSINEQIKPIDDHQVKLISNRGPDCIKEFIYDTELRRLTGVSSVLHLRGDSVTAQPLISSRFIVQWNGEIFGYESISEIETLLKLNDTEFLSEKLKTSDVRTVLSSVKGPWAVTIIDKEEHIVYFARDYFGRRSLLFNNCDEKFIITSVASFEKMPSSKWIEVTSGILYKLNLKNMNLDQESLDIGKYMISSDVCDLALHNSVTENNFVKEGLMELRKSVRKRIIYTHTTKIGILFSGGIDSLLIAAITADIIEKENLDLEINLINVAFEQAGLLKSLNLSEVNSEYFEVVPDRIGGRMAYSELKKLYPNVYTNFVALNISRFQYESEKDRVIELLQPNRTVMDLSLGIVLWFGSRRLANDSEPFKVLLLGMGADEQLGGYSRHLSAFHTESWKGLISEMQMDLDRLGHRNLGRDDRCLSDNGREARFPFLDEDFVQWLCGLPLRIKCDLTLPKGQGDKRIFRLMGIALGFSEPVAFRPKKAMQFGAKSAKISSSDCKGDDLL
jgi:asparagine synthetase B (glutamine-hydrolysing)